MEGKSFVPTGSEFYLGASLWAAAAVGVAVTVSCVVFHYEMFRVLSAWTHRGSHRIRLVYLILGLMVVHTVEIWLFAIAYLVLAQFGLGSLAGMESDVLFEYVYYSAVVYTTVGFGDVVPTGLFKLLTGMEGLIGLSLIAWSASFTFMKMRALWPEER